MLRRHMSFTGGRGTPQGGGGGSPPYWDTIPNMQFPQGTADSNGISSYFHAPGGFGTPRFALNPLSEALTGISFGSNSVVYDGSAAAGGPSDQSIDAMFEVVTVDVTGSVGGTNEICAFAHKFREGDIPSGNVPTSDSPGFQSDVQTRYPDGSVDHALIAVTGDFTADVAKTFSICSGTNPGGTPVAEAMPSGATTLSLSGIGTLDLKTLVGTAYRTARSGPVITERHYHSAVGGDATVGAYVFMRNHANGKPAFKVLLHNGYFGVAGVTQCSTRAILVIDGVTVYDSVSNIILDHHTTSCLSENASGWHWVGGDPDLWPSHDTDYLSASGAMLDYLPATVNTGTLNAIKQTCRPKTAADFAALTPIRSGSVTAFSGGVLTDSATTFTGDEYNKVLYVVSGTGAGTVSRISGTSAHALTLASNVTIGVGATYRVLEQNDLLESMAGMPGTRLGGTGDDAAIGYLSRPAACYAITGDVRALKGICADGAASSAMYSLHYPDENNIANGGVSWTTYANYQLNGSGGAPHPAFSAISNTYFSGQYGTDWDLSHAPLPGAIGYLLMGDFHYLMALHDSVNWSFLNQNPDRRGYAAGLMVRNLQARGIAWANRNLGYGASLTPSTHAYKSQFVTASGASFIELQGAMTNGLGLLIEREDYGDLDTAAGGHAKWESDYGFVCFYKCLLLGYLSGTAKTALIDLLTFMGNGLVNRMGTGAESTKWHWRFDGTYRIVIHEGPWTGAPSQEDIDANWGITFERFFGVTMGSPTAVALDSPATIMHLPGSGQNVLANWTVEDQLGAWYGTYSYSALRAAANLGFIQGAAAALARWTGATNFAAMAATTTSDPRWPLGGRKTVTQYTAGTTYTSNTFDVSITVPEEFGLGSGVDVGSYNSMTHLWTQGRDESGLLNQASVDIVPSRIWVEIAGSAPEAPLQTLLTAAMPGYNDPGNSDIGGIFLAYSGGALDPIRGRMYFSGGGHADSANNGIPKYDIRYNVYTWQKLPDDSAYWDAGYGDPFTYYPPAQAYCLAHPTLPHITNNMFIGSVNPLANTSNPTAAHSYATPCWAENLGASGALLCATRMYKRLDIASNTWTVKTPYDTPTGSYNPSTGYMGNQGNAYYDDVTSSYFFGAADNENAGFYTHYNIPEDEWTQIGALGGDYYGGKGVKVGRKAYTFVQPRRNLLNSYPWPPKLRVFDFDTKEVSVVMLTHSLIQERCESQYRINESLPVVGYSSTTNCMVAFFPYDLDGSHPTEGEASGPAYPMHAFTIDLDTFELEYAPDYESGSFPSFSHGGFINNKIVDYPTMGGLLMFFGVDRARFFKEVA